MDYRQYVEQQFKKKFNDFSIDKKRLLPTTESLKNLGFYKVITPSQIRVSTEIIMEFDDLMGWCKEQGINTVFVASCKLKKNDYVIDQDLFDAYKNQTNIDEDFLYEVVRKWNSQLDAVDERVFSRCGNMCLYAIDARGVFFTTYLSYNPITEYLRCDYCVNDASWALDAIIDELHFAR